MQDDTREMLAGAIHSSESIPSQVDLDRILQEQRRSWMSGKPFSVEDLLHRYPELSGQQDGMVDVIYAEYALREELGQTPDENEYYRRFPDHRDALSRQFQLDRLLLGEPPPPSMENEDNERIPDRIGKYRILSLLDSAGQSRIYRGLHPTLNKEVIVKVCPKTQRTDPDKQRFRQEGQILANPDHPNLIRVHDLDYDGDRVFLVMDYVPGQSLWQRFSQQTCSPEQTITIIRQVADALAHLHKHGIIHLDVTPRNIIIGDDGTVHLIDFGLVRYLRWFQTNDDEIGLTGTPEFMAPEQAKGERNKTGPRTDIFGLGGVLYFLLTGQTPIPGDTLPEVLANARRGDIDLSLLESSRIPHSLAHVCRVALAIDPKQRFPDMETLSAEIANERKSKTNRSRPLLAVLSALVLTVLVFVLTTFWPTPEPEKHPTPIQAVPSSKTPRIAVQVWAPNGYRPLTNIVPLQTGDKLQFRIRCPDHMYCGLFHLGTSGKLQLLGQSLPGTDRVISYPKDPDKSVPLVGKPGTELLLLCCKRNQPVTLADVADKLPKGISLSPLSPYTVLRLTGDGITQLTKSRDLGKPRDTSNPEKLAREQLEGIRLQLSSMDYWEGLAFAHQ